MTNLAKLVSINESTLGWTKRENDQCSRNPFAATPVAAPAASKVTAGRPSFIPTATADTSKATAATPLATVTSDKSKPPERTCSGQNPEARTLRASVFFFLAYLLGLVRHHCN